METSIKTALSAHQEALKLLESQIPVLSEIASLFIKSLEKGGKIIFMGNGGSAADAQHLAAELIGRFKKNRGPLAAIALTTNSSILTALGNDFGFEEIFTRQIKALAKEGDLVVGLSTSGKSKNVIKAMEATKALNIKSVGFLGKDDGYLSGMTNISLNISLDDTPRIQEMHILAGHIICGIVEDRFADG